MENRMKIVVRNILVTSTAYHVSSTKNEKKKKENDKKKSHAHSKVILAQKQLQFELWTSIGLLTGRFKIQNAPMV